MNFFVSRYQTTDAGTWDDFVRSSRNGTFLLERGFMDYHANRFQDHSLLVHDEGGQLAAVVPANAAEGDLHSHAGLTYGGFVYGKRGGAPFALAMLDSVRSYMRDLGFRQLHYKTIPWIYHRQPAEDDRYALFRANAQLVRRDVLSVIARDDRLRYRHNRRHGMNMAMRAGVEVEESTGFEAFWPLLEATLQDRHGVSPVHSLQEIGLLQSRFPNKIRLFIARLDGQPVAGVVVFETTRVAHVQYISSGEAGRQIGALDMLFNQLLSGVYRDKPFFDFGISNEGQGRVLNLGLVEQKESFGARTVVHDHYLMQSGLTP